MQGSRLKTGNLFRNAELEAKITAITPAQVNAAMQKYITPDKITIIKAGDFAKTKNAGQ
ncbi:MAG: hypothetical protein LC730_05485 [Acidobacteria bacterium]|nr:hypothetical protein [Acidobacteriota bacterium]MCA1608894.1 hypothetical protein [Acidobacteriota bacterium]